MSKKRAIVFGSYEFIFDSVIHHKQGYELFVKHAEKEHNSENLYFIQDYENFKKDAQQLEQEALEKRAAHLVDKFFKPKSTLELNVGHIQQRVLEQFASKKNLATLFDEASGCVMLIIQKEMFPRFVRSALWKNFVCACDEKSIKDFAISRSSFKFSLLSEADIKRHTLQAADIDFALLMLEDFMHWFLIHSQQRFLIYCSSMIMGDHALTKKIGHLLAMKAVMDVPVSALDYINVITSNEYRGMLMGSQFSNYGLVEYIPGTAYTLPTSVNKYEFTAPMMQKRSVLNASTVLYFPNRKMYLICSKACEHDKYPEDKATVRAITTLYDFVFEISASQSKFIRVLISSPRGYMSPSKPSDKVGPLIKALYVSTWKNTKTGTEKACSQYVMDNAATKTLTDQVKIKQTLLDNASNPVAQNFATNVK